MRKNFTQKFLTIFVFLTVYAFGFKAYAQPAPADCDIDNGGRIAVGSGTEGRDTICRGANAPLIRGSQQNAVSDTGTGQGGGPLVTFQWQYRNASTGGVFRNVDASVLESDPANCNNPRNCTGTGPNFNPGFLTQTTDFVRIRYSGSTTVPQNCFKVSNVVTIYAQDFTKPTIQTCVSSFSRFNNAGTCFTNITLPRPGNFGRVDSQDPNGVFASDNCTSNTATTGRPQDSLRLSYRLADGTVIANNASRTYSFPVGSTQVLAVVTDSSGNEETCPFTVTVVDTSKPRYTGPRLLNRSTDLTQCAASLVGTELAPMFVDCPGQVLTINYEIYTSNGQINNGRRFATTSEFSTGSNGEPTPSGTITQDANNPNPNIGDRVVMPGTYYIAFRATDNSGNFSGTGAAPGTFADTLVLIVRDQQKPLISAPTSRSFNMRANGDATQCGRSYSNLITQPSPAAGANNPRSSGGTFSGTLTPATSPATMTAGTFYEACPGAVVTTFGPDYLLAPINTTGTRPDGTTFDNTIFRGGANTVKYIVTDAAGNRDSVTQTITIVDTIKPSIAFLPANETQNTSNFGNAAGNCQFNVAGLVGRAVDNCRARYVRYFYQRNGVTYATDTANVDSTTGRFTVRTPFTVGTTVVKVVAYDTTFNTVAQSGGSPRDAVTQSGLTQVIGTRNPSDTGQFTVTINDNSAPVMGTCPAFTLRLDNNGNGTLTPANVGSGNVQDCSPLTFSLSQTNFTCANMGANTVTLTATDANGFSSTCQAQVTVVSNIVTTTTSTGQFCNNSGTLTVTATGGSGSYTYNIISGPSDNTSGDSDGTYDSLNGGNYVVRVTDGLGCFTDANVTVGDNQKETTDVAVTASAPDNFFGAVGDTRQVLVTVRELGGFASDSAVVRIAKAQASGYTFNLGTGFDNANWTRREDASFVYFQRTGGLACGAVSTLSVNMTRSNPASQQFSVTFRLIGPSEQSADYRYNDSFSVLFVGQ